MDMLLALVSVALVLALARRGFLHPGDYLVAAGLAILLAASLWPALPTANQLRVLATMGAPQTVFIRSEFLQAHGLKIVIGALLFAVASCVSAELRRRVTPEQYA